MEGGTLISGSTYTCTGSSSHLFFCAIKTKSQILPTKSQLFPKNLKHFQNIPNIANKISNVAKQNTGSPYTCTVSNNVEKFLEKRNHFNKTRLVKNMSQIAPKKKSQLSTVSTLMLVPYFGRSSLSSHLKKKKHSLTFQNVCLAHLEEMRVRAQ